MADTPLQGRRSATTPGLKEWLFDPFTYIAGARSLLLGLVAVLFACLVGFFSNTHFDGVLDVHTGRRASAGAFLLEGIIDWLSLASMLFIAGKLSSRTAFRAIDLFGTQALARWPTVITASAALAPPYRRLAAAIGAAFMRSESSFSPPATDLAVFALVLLVMLFAQVLMVVLMYRAYSLCCNLKGLRAAITFIIGLVVAELISKLAIMQILTS